MLSALWCQQNFPFQMKKWDTRRHHQWSPVEMLPVAQLFRLSVIPLFAKAMYNYPQASRVAHFTVWTRSSSTLHLLTLFLSKLISVLFITCFQSVACWDSHSQSSLCHVIHVDELSLCAALEGEPKCFLVCFLHAWKPLQTMCSPCAP